MTRSPMRLKNLTLCVEAMQPSDRKLNPVSKLTRTFVLHLELLHVKLRQLDGELKLDDTDHAPLEPKSTSGAADRWTNEVSEGFAVCQVPSALPRCPAQSSPCPCRDVPEHARCPSGTALWRPHHAPTEVPKARRPVLTALAAAASNFEECFANIDLKMLLLLSGLRCLFNCRKNRGSSETKPPSRK